MLTARAAPPPRRTTVFFGLQSGASRRPSPRGTRPTARPSRRRPRDVEREAHEDRRRRLAVDREVAHDDGGRAGLRGRRRRAPRLRRRRARRLRACCARFRQAPTSAMPSTAATRIVPCISRTSFLLLSGARGALARDLLQHCGRGVRRVGSCGFCWTESDDSEKQAADPRQVIDGRAREMAHLAAGTGRADHGRAIGATARGANAARRLG